MFKAFLERTGNVKDVSRPASEASREVVARASGTLQLWVATATVLIIDLFQNILLHRAKLLGRHELTLEEGTLGTRPRRMGCCACGTGHGPRRCKRPHACTTCVHVRTVRKCAQDLILGAQVLGAH